MATTNSYPHTLKYAITKTDYEALHNRLSIAADQENMASECWINTLFFASYRSRTLPPVSYTHLPGRPLPVQVRTSWTGWVQRQPWRAWIFSYQKTTPSEPSGLKLQV